MAGLRLWRQRGGRGGDGGGVIFWIWPLAGIAVKAVSRSELSSSPAQVCVRIHTDKGEKKTHAHIIDI